MNVRALLNAKRDELLRIPGVVHALVVEYIHMDLSSNTYVDVFIRSRVTTDDIYVSSDIEPELQLEVRALFPPGMPLRFVIR
jgi:hypothetical protein